MSRARRTNKRRVLGVGLVSAALITGAVATGAAMAGEGGKSSEAAANPGQSKKCSSAEEQSSGAVTKAVTKAKEGGAFSLSQLDGKMAGLLAAAGAQPDSLQSLDEALRAIPASDTGVLIEGIKVGSDEAPQVKVKSLNQQKPKAYAKANPNADLGQMNAQLAAVNESLAKVWSDTNGLENLQAAFGQIAVNNVIDIDDIEIDDVELELKKADADSDEMQVKLVSVANCEK
ncbi:hypothetical protein [Streptomyces sp. 8N706]|uniref:hypothetical protein n=1 Tax=Streptomyces sp. 8N706 TaxID=3457416 RepID=UPI003FD2A011